MPTNPENQKQLSWSTTSSGGPTTRTRSRPSSRPGSPSSRASTRQDRGQRGPGRRPDGGAMTEATADRADGPMLAADGTPLKTSLRRALRAQKMRALMLVAPLLVFILVSFLFPIGDMLFRSVENQIVPETLPKTVAALADWDPASGELPGEPAFAALHDDLVVAVEAQDPHPPRPAAQLRILRHLLADARRRPRHRRRWTPPCPSRSSSSRPTRSGATSPSGRRSSSSPAPTPPATSSTPSTCSSPPTASR